MKIIKLLENILTELKILNSILLEQKLNKKEGKQ